MGGGGGKGGTTTQTVSIPPEVLARYNAVNARAESVANTPFKQYSEDPNAFVAPLTPTQQAGIANTNQAAGLAQPFYNTASGMTMAGSQSVGQLTPEQIQRYQNPYTKAVADTTFQNLRQQQAQEMQGATGNAIRAGAFGGDRSGLVAANLARQQQQGTAQSMAPIYQQGYQNAVQTAAGQQGVTAADLARLQQGGQQIAALGTGAQGAALQGAQAQLAAGQTQQQTEQAGKAALYNQFLQQQGYPFQIAQFLANIAEGTGALSGSTTTTQAPGGFFSDERLKENIKKIGETNDGQPIYKYNYKGDPRTQIGLIAQDVEKSHPEAVGESQGFKTVDYDKATENSEGGAVHQFNARQGFDIGGSAAFDPNMVKELLRRQMEMYQQPGVPGGGKAPGQTGYMPAPVALPSGLSIARPASPPQQQPSGLAQAASTARGINEGLTMAEGAKTKLFGGTDDKGKPVAGWLDRSDQANALRAAQEAAQKKALEDALKPKDAHGGLITGRHHYAGGGMPYGDPEDLSQGYMKSISYDMPSPSQLKGEQDAMRAGKLPDSSAGGGLGSLAKAGSEMYAGSKLASKAYDKAMSMLDKPTPAGELASTYPAAPAGTPMPVARPEGLGAATTPAAETAAVTPATEAAAVTPAADVAATGLVAPAAETAAIAAPAVETAALAAPAAEAGASMAEILPFLFLKNGGVAREHFDDGGPVSEDVIREIMEKQVAPREGGGNPQSRLTGENARNSDAAGSYGMLGSTWRNAATKAGIPWQEKGWLSAADAPHDVQTQAMMQYAVPHARTLESHGLPVTGATMHAMSFNPAAAPGILKMPDDAVLDRDTLIKAGWPEKNLNLTLENPINRAVLQNKDGSPITVAQFKARMGGTGGGAPSGPTKAPSAVESGLGSVKKSLSDAGDYYTKNREHIIPIIAGLGSMLASNKPNLGQAIGEGLIGYGASAADMMKRAADVESTRMGTEQTRQNVVNARFTVDANGVGRVTYQRPDGSLATLYESEYRAMPPEEREKLNLDPAVKKEMDEHIAKKSGATGIVPPPATGTTTTAPPAAGGTTTAPPASGGLVPAGAKPEPSPFELSSEDRKAALEEAKKHMVNPRKAASEVADVFTPQQASAIPARQQERLLTEFGSALSSLPREGSPLVVGGTSEAAIKLSGLLNSAVRMVGGDDIINPADVKNAENVRKTIENLKRNAQGNSTALGIYEALENSLPSSTQSPQGSAKNFSQVLVNNRREIDKDNYFTQWRDASAGPRNEYRDVATRTGTGLDERFNKKTAAQYEKEQNALERMYLETVPGTTSASGRPMTYFEYLSKHAHDLNDKEKEIIAKKFGAPHILRYFPASAQ